MRYLTVGRVADFCAWDQYDLEELARIDSWLLPPARRAKDWKRVATVSVAALGAGLSVEESGLDAWCDYGRGAGLKRGDLDAYESLWMDPIAVSRAEWINGRHRASLFIDAGVEEVAVVDLAWAPVWAR